MKKTQIFPDLTQIPTEFHRLISSRSVYDSSCSPEARVLFIDNGDGYYLKSAAKGSLEREFVMTRFFHGKDLGAEVLEYVSAEQDWLLTRKLLGDDCITQKYLAESERLCDTCAELLRRLHDERLDGCPVTDVTQERLFEAKENYRCRKYDTDLFPDNWGYASSEEAWTEIERNGKYLRTDTLLHGDYCLPNILLDDWQFSGFIDLCGAGVGDRHFDLFWGSWSLCFNLKTDKYRERFLDVYGRDHISMDALRTIAAIEVFG